MSYAKRSCGCLTPEGYEQALKDAERTYKKVYVVEYFGRCCSKCVDAGAVYCVILTDYTFEEMQLVHGITLQKMQYIFHNIGEVHQSPVSRYVRYADENTSSDLQNYASKLSMILTGLLPLAKKDSIVEIHGKDNQRLVLSKQSVILADN